jgi:hypothetical protein
MGRIQALSGQFSIDWSPISRIVMNPCMIYRNLSFGNHLGETCLPANMSMIV